MSLQKALFYWSESRQEKPCFGKSINAFIIILAELLYNKSALDMKKVLLILLPLITYSITINSQIYAFSENVPSATEKSIESRFLSNSIVIHEIDIQNSNRSSIGYFGRAWYESGSIRDGVVLSTGQINGIPGEPSDLLSSDQNTSGFTPFDSLYNTGNTFDAVFLRIVFTPLGETVNLRYFLASENYEEDICEINNDWLGVFIRPENEWGGSNWINLATIPGKPTVPVSPNTINSGNDIQNTLECSRLDPDWQSNQAYYTTQEIGLKFNAMTKALSTETQVVVPGKKYEMIIVIADGEDPFTDSAIFFDSPNFRSITQKPFIKLEEKHEICVGDSIEIGGEIIREAGKYVTHLSDDNAAVDTFLVTTLTTFYKKRNVSHFICRGESVLIRDVVFTEQVLNYPDTIKGGECDSIVYHNVIIREGNRSEAFHQLCAGETLYLGDTSFTSDGYYEEVIDNENSCDEKILHHFEFSSPIINEVVYNACEGDVVTINDIDYIESTSFDQVFTATGGCDSIIRHQIVFDESYYRVAYHESQTRDGIPFDTIFVADTFFLNDDIYLERKIIPGGCDTLIEHRINIQSLELYFDESLDRSFCIGDSIRLTYGENYFSKKNYREWVQDIRVSIPNEQGTRYSSTMTIDDYPFGTAIEEITDLSFIGITLDHNWITDLDITLTCPSGSTVKIQQHQVYNNSIKISGDSVKRTYWSPYHKAPWGENGKLVLSGNESGTYENLNQLIGCPLNGDWTLTVEDFWDKDDGYLWDWSIGFPDTESVHQIEKLLFWGWLLEEGDHNHINITSLTDPSTSHHPHAILTSDQLGSYTVKNSLIYRRTYDIGSFYFPFTITDPYTGPTETLDTLFCGPGFLYDTPITQSGTYEVHRQNSDYCTSIPVIANVTVIPTDTTLLSEITCKFADSDLVIDTLSNQYGCDSLIFTGLQLVVDTVFSQNISCLPNISAINRSLETLEVVVTDGCDYVSVIEHLEVPIDTIRWEEVVCDPDEVGETIDIFSNQYGCDSIVIIQHLLALDTTYLTATTCQFEEVGIQQEILSNVWGCDSLIITDVSIVVDTVYTTQTVCGPADTPLSTNTTIENIEVADACDYVSVETILSAPTDTTFLITPSCQRSDSLALVSILGNQYGCDSVVVTNFNLRLDTIRTVMNECTAGITQATETIDGYWTVSEAGCDVFQMDITHFNPLDTSLIITASCNPQDTGTFFQTLANQYQCDSLVISQVLFEPDTSYLETNTCYPQDSGWHMQVLEQADGCQLIELEYRSYQPLEYDWLVTADTCGFGQGSATFVPVDTNLQYTFNWDGPAVDINPDTLFQGVYSVTISAEGDFYPAGCLDTSRVIIGSISTLPMVSYTYSATDLDYSFVSELTEADSFYWDFGDGNRSTAANTTHTFAQTGTYTVCLIARNGCGTAQDCQAVRTIDGFAIAGEVETAPPFPAQTPISGVNITLTSDRGNSPVQTGPTGSFSYSDQFVGYDYQLEASKNDGPLNGLDVIDVLKISQAANGLRELEAPYQLLAADVNCDVTITIADAIYLNDLLLGQESSFPTTCSSWLFWPQSYVFPNPETPFNFDAKIHISGFQQEMLSNDFYGLKRGDLGGNADAQRSPTSLDTLFLSIENGTAEAGDTIQLDFRVRHFTDLVGVQFEFVFDTFALSFIDMELGDLPALTTEHFGLADINKGVLRCIWVDLLGQTHSLADNDEFFSLRLLAKQKIIDRQSKMEITERELRALCFNGALEEGAVRLLVDDITSVSGLSAVSFQLGYNRPNPFTRATIIPFSLPQQANVALQVYNQLGQLVWQREGSFPAGTSELEVQLDQPGLYYYSLDTPWGKATRKMVGYQ